MKKLLCLALVVILCMAFVACNSNSNNTTTQTSSVVDVTKERKDKLSDAYDSFCDSTKDYAKLASDGLSLVIDSNPDDRSYYQHSSDAIAAIVNVNDYLGLPESVNDKMESTRALDGMQTQDCGDYTVSWNYHPDNGLKVIYEVNND